MCGEEEGGGGGAVGGRLHSTALLCRPKQMICTESLENNLSQLQNASPPPPQTVVQSYVWPQAYYANAVLS